MHHDHASAHTYTRAGSRKHARTHTDRGSCLFHPGTFFCALGIKAPGATISFWVNSQHQQQHIKDTFQQQRQRHYEQQRHRPRQKQQHMHQTHPHQHTQEGTKNDGTLTTLHRTPRRTRWRCRPHRRSRPRWRSSRSPPAGEGPRCSSEMEISERTQIETV